MMQPQVVPPQQPQPQSQTWPQQQQHYQMMMLPSRQQTPAPGVVVSDQHVSVQYQQQFMPQPQGFPIMAQQQQQPAMSHTTQPAQLIQNQPSFQHYVQQQQQQQ